ncbi:MAG: VanZ family protein [Eubacterium sp.]|nr:VanZ family protein [Eubacterium sp.]
MLRYLNSFLQPIYIAFMFFPAIAALFTLPFIIKHYRKYGGIAIMRTIVVYSFILYCMCTFLLTVLPLPTREAVMAMPDHPIGWIPGRDLYIGLKNVGLNFGNITNVRLWIKFFTSSDFFQVLFNIVMTIPLGIYLRYYFRFSLRETALTGLCASLFFEVTQYTALYGIYPKPYRFTEIDDLINNTLGAVIGYAITPIICKLLPTREEIDKISYKKGENVTVLRRFFAFVLDIVLSNLIFALIEMFFMPYAAVPKRYTTLAWMIILMIYFGLLPIIFHKTFGQMLLKLKLVSEDGEKLNFKQIIGRNFLLYGVEFFMLYMTAFLFIIFVMSIFKGDHSLKASAVVSIVCLGPIITELIIILRIEKKWNKMPHSHYSHTDEIAYGKTLKKE